MERYLIECVDSILSQTFTDFELILVNDGSIDGSPAICDEYAEKDARVKVIHKVNGGQAIARNIGTEAAKGTYIIYIDSDDYILANRFFESVYEKTKKEADVVCYKFRKYFEDEDQLKDCSFKIPEFNETDSAGKRIMALVSSDAFYCAPWTKAIKRSVLLKGDVRFEDGLLSEDQEWYYHVLINSEKIEGIDQSFIAYRQRRNSTSKSWDIKNLTDTIYIIKKWYKTIKDSELEHEYKTALLNSVAKLYCNLLIGYTRFNDSDKKKYYKDLKELSSLMQYHLNPRVNTFYKFYRIGGFSLLMLGLQIICKVR